jgi:hypothetical protein
MNTDADSGSAPVAPSVSDPTTTLISGRRTVSVADANAPNMRALSGIAMTSTPAADATSTAPARTAQTAREHADKLDAHAFSTLTIGTPAGPESARNT